MVSDARLLYCTLVNDGALPSGYEAEFEGLMRTVVPAAERQARAYAQLKPEDSSLWLLRLQAAQLESEKKAQRDADSFRAAWAQKPRRFRTKFERTLHMGHTPRKDAEEEERTRWIHELAQLVAGSQTPMGKLLLEEPSNVKVLGAGLRASTLRSRVRHLRRFFSWLELTRGVRFPSELSQLTDYLRVRLSEPCNRGALKNTNEAFGFYEQVTGTPEAERHTSKELYQVVYRELRSNALPGRPTKQAPRMPVMLLEALERLVLNSDAAPYLRVFAWWVLLQNWATLRFSDHRGLSPSDITVSGGEFIGKLTRSKTIGADKSIQSRPVVVSSCCYVVEPQWVQAGWKLLSRLADFPRDYLLPTPATNLGGVLRAELRYDTGFAILNRTLSAVRLKDGSEVPSALAVFWTPHSGRAFMPSASAALNFPREERNFLGGWQAQASDRYARVARLRVQNIQKAVVRTFQEQVQGDPLGESETFTHMEEFLVTKGCSEERRKRLLDALQRWDVAAVARAQEELQAAAIDPEASHIRAEQDEDAKPDEHPEPDAIAAPPAKKKRGGHALVKTETLGENPRARRAAIRATLRQGYYVCLSGKRGIRTLHRLGACYALPDVDYLHYEFVGECLPKNDLYDTICRLCARTTANPDENSDASATSSSSQEPGLE